MNSLNRQLMPGEEVVVLPEAVRAEFRQDPEELVFVCSGGGFGSMPETSGTKAYGYWKKQGPGAGDDFIRGPEIDVKATAVHQRMIALGDFAAKRSRRGGKAKK